MNEIMKEKLARLNDDEVMLHAIEKVLEKSIELARPDINPLEGDEVIGQKFRAYIKAQEIARNAIDIIKSYKEYTEKPKTYNKAR